jgi:CheY-like chemotaxis protein
MVPVGNQMQAKEKISANRLPPSTIGPSFNQASQKMSATPQISKRVRVLSVSADAALRHTRELLLVGQGCEVETSLSKAHAQQLIQSHSFDVLIIGNSLSEQSCREFAKSFRARNPHGKIIEIVLADWDLPMNKPDGVAAGPEELVALIREFALD